MKKRWIVFFMVSLLLVTMLASPVFAEDTTGGSNTESSPTESKPTDPTESKPTDPTESKPTDPTESKPTDPTESKPTEPAESKPGTCTHVWVDVTVPSTCTEAGGVCQVCATCEEVVVKELLPLAAHTYDSPCDTDCNVCAATREAAHKFSAGWDYSSTKHWHPCSLCGAKSDEGAHYPGPAATEDKDQICLTCGKVMTKKRSHTHEKTSEWKFDETGHWYACKDCEEQLEFAAHRFDGACGGSCLDCGYVPEGGHAFSNLWSFNEEEHWKVCMNCGAESDREPHSFDPDAAEQVCSVCADAPMEETEAAVHVHEYLEDWERDDGSHWHVCDCGEITDKAPHVWDEGTPNEDGTVTYSCNTCQAEKTEVSEAGAASTFPAGIVFTVLGITIVGLSAALVTLLVLSKKSKKKGHFSH